MIQDKKLATAALAGLLAIGTLSASAGFADDHEKSACKSKSGCGNKITQEKSECKSHTDKSSCTGKTDPDTTEGNNE